jgi:hypothetical protein
MFLPIANARFIDETPYLFVAVRGISRCQLSFRGQIQFRQLSLFRLSRIAAVVVRLHFCKNGTLPVNSP